MNTHRRVFTSLALLGSLTIGCSAEYADWTPEGEQSQVFGTAEAAVAACEGDDLQYDFNAFAASLAVAVANEMGRWDVLTDFELQNGRLELSSTGRAFCEDSCDNVEALLALQDDASSEVPYHSPSLFRSKLATWYQTQEQTLIELGTAGTQSEGTYRIVARYGGKRMTVEDGSMSDGARIKLWDWTSATGADEWQLQVSGKGHKLVNVRSGKCMESSAGSSGGWYWDGYQWTYGGGSSAALSQQVCSDSNAQVFEVRDIDGGYVGLLDNSGKALAVENWQTNNGTPVVANTWNQYETNKAWRLERVSGNWQDDTAIQPGMYELVAKHSGKPIAVRNSSLDDGAAVVQGGDWGFGEDSQQWYAQKVGDRFQLVNRHSGLCLAALGGWSSESMGQKACANVDDQKFQIEKVNSNGETYYGLRGPYGKVVKVKDYDTSSGANVVLQSSDFGEYSAQFRFDDILGGEPHRLEFSHVTDDGPCGEYYWYEIRQPNGLNLSAPEESFVQLIFAGGKNSLDGEDENPFIAQQVSGTLVGIDPSGYMNGGSRGSSGSCVKSDIIYDRTRSASGDCCIRYNGSYGTFTQSFWSSSTFICR